ncbi:ABC-2 type transport system permease protein [Carnobacterium iners]|uniref:Transport permease protein n=1 Tax=Carnobacterium iners TaxID=1073423 RepID=A0A1X7N141_9LACT|nr:ABC transporter permease [Carnobacterium iners]SEK19708.1 ABC-2 type transport system permease protein [Carnobacterium iners]SMH30070.1 ABC-2 type transport system permease protein [Carnobacterium iners]
MRTISALWLRNIRGFVRDRVKLVTSLVIPFFFLYVFSSIFKNDQVEDPIAFLLAGIIVATVFQTSLNIATSTIDDTVSGFMKEILVSPTSRFKVALGQMLSAATISTAQGILILIIGFFTGLRFTNWETIIYVLFALMMVGLVFSGLGLFLASKVKSASTFQVVQQAVVLPFTFLSGAYIPIDFLPKVLKFVSYFNPMTYTTAFFRTIMLEKGGLPQEDLLKLGLVFDLNGFIITPWMSGGIIAIFGALFLYLATNSFVRADFNKISRNPLASK